MHTHTHVQVYAHSFLYQSFVPRSSEGTPYRVGAEETLCIESQKQLMLKVEAVPPKKFAFLTCLGCNLRMF